MLHPGNGGAAVRDLVQVIVDSCNCRLLLGNENAEVAFSRNVNSWHCFFQGTLDSLSAALSGYFFQRCTGTYKYSNRHNRKTGLLNLGTRYGLILGIISDQSEYFL